MAYTPTFGEAPIAGNAGPRVGATTSGRKKTTVANLDSKQGPLVIPGTGLQDWLAYSNGMLKNYQGYMQALTGFSQIKANSLANRAVAIAKARQAAVQGAVGNEAGMTERGVLGSSMEAMGMYDVRAQEAADITAARTTAASQIGQGQLGLMQAQQDYQTTQVGLQQQLAASRLMNLSGQLQSGYMPYVPGQQQVNPFAGQGVGVPIPGYGKGGVQQVAGTGAYAPRMQ